MIYRVWITWGRRKCAIVLPINLFLASFICITVQTYELSQFKPGESAKGCTLSISPLFTSSAMLTLCNNVTCCALIAYKLYAAHAQSKPHGRNLLWLLSVLVESAALYVLWTMAYLMSCATHSPLEMFFAYVWPDITGIAFMLINIRIGAGWDQHTEHQSPEAHNQFVAQSEDLSFATFGTVNPADIHH